MHNRARIVLGSLLAITVVSAHFAYPASGAPPKPIPGTYSGTWGSSAVPNFSFEVNAAYKITSVTVIGATGLLENAGSPLPPCSFPSPFTRTFSPPLEMVGKSSLGFFYQDSLSTHPSLEFGGQLGGGVTAPQGFGHINLYDERPDGGDPPPHCHMEDYWGARSVKNSNPVPRKKCKKGKKKPGAATAKKKKCKKKKKKG